MMKKKERGHWENIVDVFLYSMIMSNRKDSRLLEICTLGGQ